MFNPRSLSSLVVLAVALALPLEGITATPEDNTQGSSDQLFQAYTQMYFARRDLDFALEMTLRESFLTWLYEGVNREVAERSKEDPIGTLSAVSPPELAGFDELTYAYPDSLDEAPLRIRYVAWEGYLRNEFNHKYLQARLIKDRLIQSGTPEQRRRMFKNDLESSFISYRDGMYRETILKYDELIDRYGYTDLGDIAFFRGEAYLAIQLYEPALADYQYVVDHSTEPWYRLRSLERLISLVGDRGNAAAVSKYWKQYDTEATVKGEDYWATADLAGRYLLAKGEWEVARGIFDLIPLDSPQGQVAAVRAADCQTALLNLDDASARYTAILKPEKGKKSLPENLVAEANLKLGYIDYLKGDFDKAYSKLSAIKAEGDVGERAEIGSIWALYRLSAYPQVITRAEKYITDHPQSQYLYEARSLIGFADEMMGQSGGALDNYKIIMSALDDRQDFHDYNYELKAISTNLGRLEQLEEAIFLGGERELFGEYIAVRKKLNSLTDGVRFVRAIKSTPFLKDIIREQKELYEVFAQQGALEQDIYEAQDTKLHDKYQDAIGSLTDIGSQLSAGVKYYMKQRTLIQREEDKRYEIQTSDSLKKSLEREWESTRQAMALTKQYLESSENTDAKTMIDLAGVEIELTGLQDRILKVQSELRKYGQDVVTSNLDEWSDFAYQRYTYGGLNFDFLYSRENRLGELDDYIQQINGLLQDRAHERADTLKLAAELVPASKAGDPPYFAPPVPLWGVGPAVAKAEPLPVAPDTTTSAIPAAAPVEESVAPATEEVNPPVVPADEAQPPVEAAPEIAPTETNDTPTAPPPDDGGSGGEKPQNGQ